MRDEHWGPTLRDVGRQAGVSYQTVSRVINHSKQVSPDTRKMVMAAAECLGFRINRMAGSLRKNQSQMIGLVMSDVANLFFAEVVGGVEAEAALHDYSVLLANSSEDITHERAAVIGLMERRVDGLIVAPAEGDHSYLTCDLPANFPLVAINRSIDEFPCSAVLSENESGARRAVRYLAEHGHTRIGALVGTLGLMTSRERLAGFRAGLQEAGLVEHADWIAFGGLNAESGRHAALKLLGSAGRPTAVFASSNAIAAGLLLAIKQLGLQRNSDVEVIGFDDVPWSRLVEPPMPVIAQDTKQIGRNAVRMLLGIVGGERQRVAIERIPTQLITNDGFGVAQ
jgi:LacI family transcriptional regulator